MKIVEAQVNIINPFEDYGFVGLSLAAIGSVAVRMVEFGARISHGSEDDAGADTEGFLKRVIVDRADWSVAEHAFISVDAIMDRGCTHEWVRHRIAGYTQSSTRFINYVKKMPPSFIYPQVEGDKFVRCEHCLAGNEPIYEGSYAGHQCWQHCLNRSDMPADIACTYDADWLAAMHNAETMYKSLLSRGWRPQEARSVFPNALASRIVTTANLRSWRHFFLMRTTKQAQPQIRQLATNLLTQFQAIIPVLYDDIVPMQSQKFNAGLGR